jgi:uncharacterized protein (DUF1499 family)
MIEGIYLIHHQGGTAMKIFLIAILIVVSLFVVMRIYARSGSVQQSFPPGTIPGITNGKLAACKSSPNCISSQAEATDTMHYAEPIAVPDAVTNPKQRILDILTATPGAVIIEDKGNYVRAEFTTKIMRYIDDVEFVVDTSKRIIDFRSASRVGYSDMGLNRKRIEQIRASIVTP